MERRRAAGEWKDDLWPILLISGLSALFFLAFFNRFAGVRSGDGEFSGGVALLAGRLPYRDYYTAGPPLNQIKSAMELWLFGKTLIVSRIAGVVERVAVGALLYLWLRRVFSRWAATVASLVTVIVSAGDHVDPIASYNHDAIFWAVVCGLTASVALEPRKRWVVWALLAGVAVGLSALTKQTVGLGTAVAVVSVCGVASLGLYGWRRMVVWVGVFGGGFAVPVGLVALYLHHLRVLRACLLMLFVKGPAAKASGAGSFLWRDVVVAAGNPVWLGLGIVGLWLGWKAVRRAVEQGGVEQRQPAWGWVPVGGVGVIGIAEVLALVGAPALQNYSKSAVYYAFFGTAVVGVDAVLRGLKKNEEDAQTTQRSWEIALLAAVGWSVAFTLSLSWPVFEAMAVPGLGLMVAAAMDGARGRGRQVLYAVLAATVFFQVDEKLSLPFSFAHEDEPGVRFATHTSDQRMLEGMRLPAETVRFLDETVTAVRGFSAEEDTLFTYPEMGLLYPLTGKNPPTFAGSHNIDVVSDEFAREEAGRLRQHCPAVLVYARPMEHDLYAEDAVWRGGRRSGQHDLVGVLDSLLPSYKLADTFVLAPGDNPIGLYVRTSKDCGLRLPIGSGIGSGTEGGAR